MGSDGRGWGHVTLISDSLISLRFDSDALFRVFSLLSLFPITHCPAHPVGLPRTGPPGAVAGLPLGALRRRLPADLPRAGPGVVGLPNTATPRQRGHQQGDQHSGRVAHRSSYVRIGQLSQRPLDE